MKIQNKTKNVFTDKATLLLRKMIQYPERQWVVRDFTGPDGVSLGLAQGVLEALEKRGYIERKARGPLSRTILTNKQALLEDWCKAYRFDQNEVDVYYSHDKKILSKLKSCFKNDQYALTLHTGANQKTSFVRTDNIYIYCDLGNWEKNVLEIRQKLDLKELKSGGNIYMIRPFYKKSAFYNTQKINGLNVVSNLQLYLDLFHFNPRGREHAEYLKSFLEQKGAQLD